MSKELKFELRGTYNNATVTLTVWSCERCDAITAKACERGLCPRCCGPACIPEHHPVTLTEEHDG